MRMYEAINVKLADDERDVLRKADEIICDIFEVMEQIKCDEGKEVIFPPAIMRLMEDVSTLRLSETSLKTETGEVKSYPR